ncbi:SWIM zinc finger domain-containing protein [Alicyclobacillus sp. SO9]|uniref:SWIM zinc finger family protein n=1 Tax=Alicyclobacillus sp. SO9 TaxID=2665646 RepID=UPI0018E7D1D1|nr:SWIM zinc finger family protein [Alicyclobacillus sp. SO9]QQE79171.1 SWIM zinc finger family protein [Alicyclobacillus sp. SO9]
MNKNTPSRQLEVLLHGLGRWVEPHIIQRGRDYYELGNVERLEVRSDFIEAVVRGSTDHYQTSIHIANFPSSECNCPYEDYCKHMVAVVYAAAAQENAAQIEGDNPVQASEGRVMALLSTLPHDSLMEVIDLALQDNPEFAQHISLWFGRWQTRQGIKRVLVGMDTLQAISYFDKRVPAVVRDAEQTFKSSMWDEDEPLDQYDDWADPVYSSPVWHCKGGIAHIRNWCDTLLAALTPETAVAVVIGVALTLSRVASWPRFYPEAVQQELLEAPRSCSRALDQALRTLRDAMVQDQQVRSYYNMFTDWIADSCKDMVYLVDWTEVLSSCLFDASHLMQFYHRLVGRHPAFLLSAELTENMENMEKGEGGLGTEQLGTDDMETSSPISHNSRKKYTGYGLYLADWWCRLCLQHGLSAEAEKAVQATSTETGPAVDVVTLQNLGKYFARHDDAHKAAYYTGLAIRVNPKATVQDYEWAADMYKTLEMIPESIQARKQAFLTWPTWQRFEQWQREEPSVEERQATVKEWVTNALASKTPLGLRCRMLWTVGLVEEAWDLLNKKTIAPYLADADLVQFLRESEGHNLAQSVNIYLKLAVSCIDERRRSAYREATTWLLAIRDAWMRVNQLDAWQHLIAELKLEYRRLPALQSELNQAGLV